MIYDVVTGKVDVHGIEVPEENEEDLSARDEESAEADNLIDGQGNLDEPE